MLYVILLLILAVLLFGSSAVIGALGWILGFIVALIAMVWAGITFEITMQGWAIAIIGFVILLGVANYVLQEMNRPAGPKG